MKIDVASLVPGVIRELDEGKPWSKWVPGSVLFADVSGFTPMSEALSKLGVEGAEILTDVLNLYFSEMIGIIQDFGGDVMKFGGDAILCFFPGQDTLPATIYAALKMQRSMSKFQAIKTPVKRFALKMKIGIAHGDVLIAGVGDPAVRCDYVFAGTAVDLTSDAEHNASAGDIVLTCTVDELNIEGLVTTEIVEDFYLVHDIPEAPCNCRESEETRSEIVSYIIKEIYEMVDQGYDRHIGTLQGTVPAFVQFTGFTYHKDTFNLQQFNDFFSSVMQITDKYSGRLNRISMGDKGSTFFILFGSPQPLEKKEDLACSWAIDVMSEVKSHFPEVGLKIGMNTGRVFSGIVGGSGRFDYTVMGDTVNLAARLMQGAVDYQILLSGPVHDIGAENFDFEFMGERRFKGKKDALPVYALEKRKSTVKIRKTSDQFTGRAEEVQTISTAMENAREGTPSMAIIEGEPGVGKSFLANHILEHAQNTAWNVVIGRGDITRQSHLYAPWVECLTALFFQNKTPTLESISEILKTGSDNYEEFLPWYADFFHVHHDLHAGEYDEETRKKLFQHQLTRILLHHVRNNPTVIFLDDLQWFDSLSVELLTSVMNHLEDQPLIILTTARPHWDHLDDFTKRSTCNLVSLQEMGRQSVIDIAERMLGAPVRDELIDILFQHAQGNPFFSINLLEYLMANNMLESRLGQWTIKKGAVIKDTISSDDIIIAQLERLSLPEKIHIRYATCVGSTFNINVFRQAMGRQFQWSIWEDLCDKNFFYHINEDFYSFQHALIQDTIYHSISVKLRRETHRQIGRAIEHLFPDTLDDFYPNLAAHFHLGQSRDKATYYSIAAGNQLLSNMSFVEAERFFRNAHSNLKYSSDERKWAVALTLVENMIYLGKFEEALFLARRIRSLTRRHNRKPEYLKSCVLQFDVMSKLSDFSYLPFAQKLLQKKEETSSDLYTRILFQAGLAYYGKGITDKAENYFTDILGFADDLEDKDIILKSHNYNASIAKRRAHFDQALELIEHGIKTAERAKSFYQELRLQIEKANILFEKGDMGLAQQTYHTLLERCEELGDTYLYGTVSFNLGKNYVDSQNLELGRTYTEEALKTFNKTGSLVGKGIALNILGIVSYFEGDLEAAYDYYFQACQIIEEVGELLEVLDIYFNLAEVCLELKRLDEVEMWLQKFYEAALQINNPQKIEAYHFLKGELDKVLAQS